MANTRFSIALTVDRQPSKDEKKTSHVNRQNRNVFALNIQNTNLKSTSLQNELTNFFILSCVVTVKRTETLRRDLFPPGIIENVGDWGERHRM